MGPFDRGLLLLYSLAVSGFLAGFGLALAGWRPVLDLATVVFAPQRREAVFACLGVLIVAGLRLLYASVRPGRKPDRVALVEENSLGQVQVALGAVESLVTRVVGAFPGVKEVKPRVTTLPEGVTIQVRLVTTPGFKIPEVSQKIQQEVKDTVREVTGIAVQNVRVLVDNITTVKPRVE